MKSKWTYVLAAALVLSVALPAAAQVRGVTDTTIKIGQWGPQTGPAAAWGSVARGTGVYFQMINDEGGINGRRIEYYLRDDGYQPSRTKAVVKELLDEVGVWGMACGVGTSPGMAVMDDLVKAGVPWVGSASGSTHWAFPPKKSVFAVYPNYPDEAQILTRYIIDVLGKKKIGVVYQNDDYGKGGLEGVLWEMKVRNMKVAAEVPVEVTDTDLQSHVLKLKSAECDAVILWVLPKAAVITVSTAAKLGYKPQWVASSTLSDAPLMHQLTKGLWKGVIFGNFIEAPDADLPLMKKYKAAYDKYADKKSDRWGVFFFAGIGFVEPMVEGIKRAGKDLSLDNYVKAMESIKNFKGIMGRVSYAPGERQGTREVFVSIAEDNGGAKKLTDWIQLN